MELASASTSAAAPLAWSPWLPASPLPRRPGRPVAAAASCAVSSVCPRRGRLVSRQEELTWCDQRPPLLSNSLRRSRTIAAATASSEKQPLRASVASANDLTVHYSRTDAEFAQEGLEFRLTHEGLDLEQLNTLFVKVGFPKRETVKLSHALANSFVVVSLHDVDQNKLVAFARATSDGIFNATIWDVVVDPFYQKRGLGKAVMERLMVQLRAQGIANITLYAEPNVVSFYKPLGFVTDPAGIRAMSFSRKRTQMW
eukprot:jgi/Chlat1/3817/Chrsp26S04052